MSHRNARLTIHGRRVIIKRVLQQGCPRAHVAAEMGVSRQCVSRWIHRFQTEGDDGLRDRSSRPHSSSTRTCAQTEAQVLACVETNDAVRTGIGPELGVPARTVSRNPAPPPDALPA